MVLGLSFFMRLRLRWKDNFRLDFKRFFWLKEGRSCQLFSTWHEPSGSIKRGELLESLRN
jgi:hypothetical protein